MTTSRIRNAPQNVLIVRRLEGIATPLSGEGIVEFDAVIEEQHESSVQLTQHPVEEVADVSDHAIERPARLVLTGVMTNTPAVSRLAQLVDPLAFKADRAEEAYEDLLVVHRENARVDVLTTLQLYEDMLVTRIAVPRNAELGNAVEMRVELEQVRIVSSETVEAPVTENPDGQTTQNRGRVPAKPTTPPEEGSVAVKAAKGLGLVK